MLSASPARWSRSTTAWRCTSTTTGRPTPSVWPIVRELAAIGISWDQGWANHMSVLLIEMNNQRTRLATRTRAICPVESSPDSSPATTCRLLRTLSPTLNLSGASGTQSRASNAWRPVDLGEPDTAGMVYLLPAWRVCSDCELPRSLHVVEDLGLDPQMACRAEPGESRPSSPLQLGDAGQEHRDVPAIEGSDRSLPIPGRSDPHTMVKASPH